MFSCCSLLSSLSSSSWYIKAITSNVSDFDRVFETIWAKSFTKLGRYLICSDEVPSTRESSLNREYWFFFPYCTENCFSILNWSVVSISSISVSGSQRSIMNISKIINNPRGKQWTLRYSFGKIDCW